MNLVNLPYRLLRRLKLQALLNWRARRVFGVASVTIPLMGSHLGSGLIVHRASWLSGAFARLAQCFPVSMLLDVGANEGQTILDLHAAGLGHLDVVSFEPNTACAYYLRQLVASNHWSTVTVLPVALSDAEQCLNLELRSQQDAGASIISDLRPGLRGIRRQLVPCFRLDLLVASAAVHVSQNFLLKLDVEGAELDVLRGSVAVLRRYRPLIVCEVLWAHCESRLGFMKARNAALLELLRDLEYDLFRLVHRDGPLSVLGLEEIDDLPSAIYSAENAHQCDYVFAPREYSPLLRGLVTRPDVESATPSHP